jgi:AbrB family looped-hinge helix DNA binding protein
MHTATVSAKGWVVIPKSIRDKHGLKKGSRVQVLDYGQILAIMPLPDDPIEALHGMFENGPSLTGELLAEREREQAKEEGSGG